jgi:putative oxidoreductase
LATFAEVLCALLVMVGLFTRWAVVPLIITMLVAVFIANMGEPLPKIELGLLYLTAFVAIGLAGPGWYSLDAQWRKP